MKILFYGDSITDMQRDRERGKEQITFSYGIGYVQIVATELHYKYPGKFEIVNRGIGGDRIVDLYARIKRDVWEEKPDVLSILIGINDIWHEFWNANGVDIERYERMYRMLIEDTKKRLPNVRIILCEPFVLDGTATHDNYENFCKIHEYAKVVQQIVKDYNLEFVPLQEELSKLAAKYGTYNYLYDGVHPNSAGAKVIADSILKVLEK